MSKPEDGNNGYLRSPIINENEQLDLHMSDEPDAAEATLQVNYGRGGTTTNIRRPSTRSRPIAIFGRAVSAMRRGHKPPYKQHYCGVFALASFLVVSGLTLLLLVLNAKTQQKQPDICLTEECIHTASSLLSGMNRSTDPCDDFFQFACGTWNRQHVIPEDQTAIGTFEVLQDKLQLILKTLLEEPANKDDNDATLKAKRFYKSCMDIAKIRQIGHAPLTDYLRSLGGWPVVEGPNWTVPDQEHHLENLLGTIRRDFIEGIILDQWIGPDDKNSSFNVLQLNQLELTLATRDHYSNKDGYLQAYHRYMVGTAKLLGANETFATEDLKKVIELEKELANASMPEVDKHDTLLRYRKLTLGKLQKEVPQLNWRVYLEKMLNSSMSEDEELVSYAMTYLSQMGRIVEKTEKRTLYNYIMWRLVVMIMPHMIDEYQQRTIEFKKVLSGVLTERARWSRCTDWTNKKLGMAVGALFVKENFNHESKETAAEMIHTIREAFNELLAENHWMDDETRAIAKIKANSIKERIGYPEFLNDPVTLSKEYLMLNVSEDKFLENIFNSLRYEACNNLKAYRQPVDKDKWTTEPVVVNAFYSPNKNEMVLPAGILQPFFYSQHFPKSLNYGGIGVVIGHEITHGFDDRGRKFDKDGNVMQWWNNATDKAFRERVQCIVTQYSGYKVAGLDIFVDGRMTQGENIADNGGLKQSFRAYKKWVARHGEERLLPGLNLTHDQLFFLNFAQIWCGSVRREDALTKIKTGTHSPSPLRVLGPLRNSVDFARAYRCPLGSKMNPIQKCSVW